MCEKGKMGYSLVYKQFKVGQYFELVPFPSHWNYTWPVLLKVDISLLSDPDFCYIAGFFMKFCI